MSLFKNLLDKLTGKSQTTVSETEDTQTTEEKAMTDEVQTQDAANVEAVTMVTDADALVTNLKALLSTAGFDIPVFDNLAAAAKTMATKQA